MDVRSTPEPPRLNCTFPTSHAQVRVLHPGYSLPTLLLAINAYDLDPRTNTPGVSHAVLIEACRIIAQNQDGYLSRNSARSAGSRVGEQETILPASSLYYYFTNDATNPCYPIVSRFQDWLFPHSMPIRWDEARRPKAVSQYPPLAMSEHVKDLDAHCVVTRFESYGACDNAHLVPRDQAPWFTENHMNFYNSNTRIVGTDDVSNGICLRADIHRCFDRDVFVPFPRGDGTEFVAYFITSEPDYAELYHRTRMDIHSRIAAEFLYARFAYSIIQNVGHADGVEIVPPNAAVEARSKLMALAKQAQPGRRRVSAPPTEESVPEKEENAPMEGVQNDDAIQYCQDINEDEFFRIFPELREPQEYSDNRRYNNLQYYPGMKRMVEMKAIYMREHPNVWQTSASEANSAKGSDIQ